MRTVLASFLLLLAVCVHGLKAPSIKYSKLHKEALEVRRVFGETGILAVPEVPGYAAARAEALNASIRCLGAPEAASSLRLLHRSLRDGALRRSAATGTKGGVLLPLDVGCADFESKAEVLRALVQVATAQVLKAWLAESDDQVLLRHSRGDAFDSVSEAVLGAKHLEHFHMYRLPSRPRRESSLELHTDAGLLLAFTAPLYAGLQADATTALWVREPSGAMSQLELADDSLAFMVGEAARWLAFPGRPVPHALELPRAPLEMEAVRAWYGLMLLLPDDAVRASGFNPSLRRQRETFSEWWKNASALAVSSDKEVAASTSLGCGLTASLDITHSCPAGEAWCWMQCMPYPPVCTLSDAVCVHQDGSPWTNTTEMCPTCTMTCPAFGGWGFCDQSAASDMIMQGFVWYGFRGSGTTPCVILFFHGWVLSNPWRFWCGVVAVFCLSIILEGVVVLQPPRNCSAKTKSVLTPLLYMLRMTLAYFVMLAAMTFCVEIFASAIAGLGTGHVLFKNRRRLGSLNGPTLCCSHGDSVVRPAFDRRIRSERSDTQITPCLQADSKFQLIVEGMTCSSCCFTVKCALEEVAGIVSANVTLGRCVEDGSLADGHAEIFVNAGFPGLEAAITAVEDVGFSARWKAE